MYEIAVAFTVPTDRREEFVAAALASGRESLAHEPGTRRFELIGDETEPTRLVLSEGYVDAAAFESHAGGPHFGAFFSHVSGWAQGPEWLVRGERIQ